MATLKLVSAYCSILLPFLSAAWTGWNAYDARHKFWRCLSGVIVTLAMLVFGVAKVINGLPT